MRLIAIVEEIRSAGKDPSEAFLALGKILKHLETHPFPRTAGVPEIDGGISCDLCQTDEWWQANFGSAWEWAKWWYCGPLGLDCPPAGVPEPLAAKKPTLPVPKGRSR